MEGKSLEDYAEDIYTCNRTRCGFCRGQCPVYRVKVYETYSCRGKMLVGRGLIEKNLSPSLEMAQILDHRLLCGLFRPVVRYITWTSLPPCGERWSLGVFQHRFMGRMPERILKEGRLLDTKAAPEKEGQTPLYVGCIYRSKPRQRCHSR